MGEGHKALDSDGLWLHTRMNPAGGLGGKQAGHEKDTHLHNSTHVAVRNGRNSPVPLDVRGRDPAGGMLWGPGGVRNLTGVYVVHRECTAEGYCRRYLGLKKMPYLLPILHRESVTWPVGLCRRN